MEIFQTSSASSSPILAYGETPSFSRRSRILACALAVFTVLAIGIILLARAKIPFPQRLIVLAAVRGGTRLPEGMPRAWKSAIEHASAPIILGLSMQESDLIPFALSLSSAQDEGLLDKRIGLFHLVSEKELNATESRPLAMVISLFVRPLFAQAYLILDPRAIDPHLTQELRGPVDARGAWHTQVRIAAHATKSIEPGDVMVDLDAFPEAWPLIQEATRNTDVPLLVEQRPSLMSFAMANHAIEIFDVQFTTPLASSTLQRLAAEFGLTSRAPYRLPDGVVVEELRLPEGTATSPSFSWHSTAGSRVELSPTRIASTHPREETSDVPPCTSGALILRLRGQALESIRDSIRLPIHTQITTIDFVLKKQHLVSCINW